MSDLNKYRIEDETPIMPNVIADTVVNELARYLLIKYSITLPDTDALADKLEAKATKYYNHDDAFRRRVKCNPTYGRDWMCSFMRHWLSADLPALWNAGKIPQSFANGEPLPVLDLKENAI